MAPVKQKKKNKKKPLDKAKKLAKNKEKKRVNAVPLDPEAIDCDWWDTFWLRNSSPSAPLGFFELNREIVVVFSPLRRRLCVQALL
jgi:hypothetical protein